MVEASRRDFLKIFGIGTTLALAPNVFVSTEIAAAVTKIPETARIDALRLNYIYNDKIYSLGRLENMTITQRQPEMFTFSGRNFAGRRLQAPLEMQLSVTPEEINNFHEIFGAQTAFNIPPKPYTGTLVGSIVFNDLHNKQLGKFNFKAEGFISDFTTMFAGIDVKGNPTDALIDAKFVYYSMKLDDK